MHRDLREHYDKALSEFSSEENYSYLLEAQKEYFEITGKLNEEDYNYESRTNLFHDWYLLQFISSDGRAPAIELYLNKYEIDNSIKETFLEFNFSLFEYRGKNFSGKFIIYDIIAKKKVALASDHVKVSLLKGELFIGRVLKYRDEHYLMNGLCVLPEQSVGIVNKQAKRVRSKRFYGKENEFLLTTESLNTKWQRYGHVNIEKIFVYPEISP